MTFADVESTSSFCEGELVPTPTFPLFCCTTNCEVPTAKPPVEIVDVAVVDVALKLPNVGVVVAVITPDAFVESNVFTANELSVIDGVEIVDVAVNDDARTLPPVNTASPETDRVLYGEVVPIPTFPVADRNNVFRVGAFPVDDP